MLGIVSEADLLLKEEFPDPDQDIPLVWTKRRHLERAKAAGSTARDLMTVALVAIPPHATVAEAVRCMARGPDQAAAGERRGRLVGIISRGDLLKVFNRPDHAIQREILDDVIVGEFMMAPSRFFLHVAAGEVVLQGQVERRSLIPPLVCAIHDVEEVVRVENQLAYDSTMSSPACGRSPIPRRALHLHGDSGSPARSQWALPAPAHNGQADTDPPTCRITGGEGFAWHRRTSR